MLAWGAPALLWQCAFFVVPLVLLVAMTFWRVRNFRLSPDFTWINWVKIFSAPYFYGIFERTFLYALTAAAVASIMSFPCAYMLAYRVGPATRRLAMFMLITPFFTSYLVRAYAWQVILADNGVLNGVAGMLGLGRTTLLNTPTATIIGYLTLSFRSSSCCSLRALRRSTAT
jgi:ABC-type spermidine/putrescine transport system permease subunit I